MDRLLFSVLLSALTFAAGLTSASAQPVERSGKVYHVAVCPGPSGPGAARCHAHVVTDSKGNPLAGNAATSTPSGYNPTDLRSAYNISVVTSWTSGTTPIIAIVDAYGYSNAESDLAVYRSTFSLPACTSGNGCFAKYNQYGVKGNYPRQNTGWAQETALDLDMASAMCPYCKIILVEANSNSFSNLAAAVNMAAQLGAHAISNSYGGGETGSQNYNAAYNHPGVAVTVSSGDSGYGVEFPATSQYVTATGGTSLTRSGSFPYNWSETVWSGAGSGCSAVYPKPSWQTDTGCSMRMEADVSAVSDPATGVAVYGPTFSGRSAWQIYGGTSVAAPLIAGIYGTNGGGVNYGSDPYGNTGSLHDVTSGSNGSCGGSYLCTAVSGYDGPTGLGTPNGLVAF
jgi:subtilase family serine protease